MTFAEYSIALSDALLAEVKRLGGSAKFMRRTLSDRRMVTGLRFELPDGGTFVFSSLPDGIRIWPGTGFDNPGFAPLQTITSPGTDIPGDVKKILGRI